VSLRVAIATWSPSVLGGAENYLRSAVASLGRRGHALGVLHESPPDPRSEPIAQPAAGIPQWCVRHLGADAALRALAGWEPDVVWTHGLAAPRLEDALLRAYPCVLFAHGYYGTCVSGLKLHSFPVPRACTRPFGPACLALYLPRRCGGLNPVHAVRDYALQSRRHGFLARYRAIAVASDHMRTEFARHGVPAERLHVLPLLADIAPDPSPPAARAPGGQLLMVGRLSYGKGGDHLLRAIPAASARLGRPLRVTFAGDGPEVPAWRALARELGVAAEFAGWVDRERRTGLAREADLLVVPSLWPEPFGLVGVEAFAVGLPAAGFASGGIPEWLRSGETGELAPADPPTPAGLADAVVRALADPGHYADLRRGAWTFARRFAAFDHAAALEAILAETAR
jgi:glycosyltransferase involved in cell wall biosynthesis